MAASSISRLRTVDERVAFEIDGLTWHVPDAERIAEYEDQLLRQNSLVHQGWRVFRWTDRQIADDPEAVKEQLALFLERIPGLLTFDDFLPKQHGEVIELKPHQEEALDALDRLRAEGITIALVTHAQGAGKTVTAITDALRLGGRTLFVAHTHELVLQAREQFRKLWPEASTGLFFGDVKDTDIDNLVGTVDSLALHLGRFKPDDFSYLIIDEAHHATAESYQKLLRYFRPAVHARVDGHARPGRRRLGAGGLPQHGAPADAPRGRRAGRTGPDPMRPRADERGPDPGPVQSGAVQPARHRRDGAGAVAGPTDRRDVPRPRTRAARRSPSASTCGTARSWPSGSGRRASRPAASPAG